MQTAEQELFSTRAGGAYIPPHKLRAMQEKIEDKNSMVYQRISWDALKKSINGLINKVYIFSSLIWHVPYPMHAYWFLFCLFFFISFFV